MEINILAGSFFFTHQKHYARPTYGPIVREGAGRNVSAETVFALAYEVLIEERTEAGARFAPVRVQDPGMWGWGVLCC